MPTVAPVPIVRVSSLSRVADEEQDPCVRHRGCRAGWSLRVQQIGRTRFTDSEVPGSRKDPHGKERPIPIRPTFVVPVEEMGLLGRSDPYVRVVIEIPNQRSRAASDPPDYQETRVVAQGSRSPPKRSAPVCGRTSQSPALVNRSVRLPPRRARQYTPLAFRLTPNAVLGGVPPARSGAQSPWVCSRPQLCGERWRNTIILKKTRSKTARSP
jgi:hypothetical protein